MTRLKLLFWSLFLLGGLVWLAGCYPNTSKATEDLDVVLTRYDEDQNFQEFKTYFIADTVVQVGDPESNGFIDLELTREEMDVVIERIRANMREFDYIEIKNPSLDSIPDAGIFTEVIGEQVTVIYTYPPGWGWGWYPGYPGWGWPGGGWWYPPAVGGYSYQVGTLLINYIDIDKTISDDGKEFIYTPWVGIANGLLQKTSSGDARITNAIDQMFDQSQYLRQ